MSARTVLIRLAWVVPLFVIAGVAGGLLWEWLWEPGTGVVQDHRWHPAENAYTALADGTILFGLVSAGVGVLCGGLLALVAGEELLMLALATAGAVAAVMVMYAVGILVAPPDPQVAAASAADGTRLPSTLRVDGAAIYLVLPLTTVLTLAMGYLFSPDRPSRRTAARAPEHS